MKKKPESPKNIAVVPPLLKVEDRPRITVIPLPFNGEDRPIHNRDGFIVVIFKIAIVVATICGFDYVNTYFLSDLSLVVIAKTSGANGSAPSSCLEYYCGASGYYYAHNYAAYAQCNQLLCSPLCGAFSCSSPP